MEFRRRRHSSTNLDDELDAIERLKMNEKLIQELNEPWEEKLKKTAIIQQQRFVGKPWGNMSFGITVHWISHLNFL